MLRFLKWALALIVVAVVGLGIAYWTPDTDPATMRAKYGTAPSQFVDLGKGPTVHLRDEGPRDGRVVVLLHGSNADLHTWDPWTAKLTAAGYRVVRFDQIGHGLTGPAPDRSYTPAAFVGTLQRVADKLGLAKFTLAGNSMGGGIAWNYAVAHPERLDGLVLVDAGGAPVDTKQSLPIGFRIARTPVLRDLMLHITPRAVIEKSLHQSVSNQRIVTPAVVDRYWELLRYPGNRQATMDRFTTERTPTDEAKIRAIKVPTLILWGAEDKLLPVSGAKWFGDRIAGSQTIVYPATGHLPMEEVADKSANDFIAWLAKAAPAR